MLIPEHWMIERLIDNRSFQFNFDDYFISLFTVFPYWFIKIRLTSPWHNKLPFKHYNGVKMCIWSKITSDSTICSIASPAKNKRKKRKKKIKRTKNGVMTQMSVCQLETEKHAGLTTIWYCQSEWVKIFKEIWVILMCLDWQNVQWTANYMLVIRTGNTSKVFNMTVCVQSSRKDFTLRLPIGRRKHQMIIILTNPTSDIWILRLTWQTCWRDFVKTVCINYHFTITITVLTTCWMAVGWGPVEPQSLVTVCYYFLAPPLSQYK